MWAIGSLKPDTYYVTSDPYIITQLRNSSVDSLSVTFSSQQIISAQKALQSLFRKFSNSDLLVSEWKTQAPIFVEDTSSN